MASPKLVVFLRTQLLRRVLTSPMLEGKVVIMGIPGSCEVIDCFGKGLLFFDIMYYFNLRLFRGWKVRAKASKLLKKGLRLK
jgi:hypothetical protein